MSSNRFLRRFDCLIERRDLSIELLLVNGFQNLADPGSRLKSEREDVPSEQHRDWRPVLHAEGTRTVEKPVHRRAIEPAGFAPETVGFRESCEQLQVHFLREPAEGAVADLLAYFEPHPRFQVLRDHTEDLAPDVVAIDSVHVEAIQEGRSRWDALFLVIHRPDPA